jgi:DNA replication and repair protein RecF
VGRITDKRKEEREKAKAGEEQISNGQRVRHLSLRHFRNYESLDLDIADGINLISGKNAQGKTNLLEAIYLLSSTRLLRGQRDTEAIQEGFDVASVAAELAPLSTVISVVLERGLRKRVLLNSLALPRASDVLGRLPCVCVSSADLPLISGEPADRRLFLDLELSQLYPAYLRHLAVFKRAVEQRNSLLKLGQTQHVDNELFETWEAQMAQHGAALRLQRMEFLSNLVPYAQEAQGCIGDGELIELSYLPKDEAVSEEDLVRAFQEGRRQEIARGSTLIGPHRDDFRVDVAGRDARLYASQGQQRTSMLSVKLGTMELERGERGSAPLLLLDDILSDLDESRRTRLMSFILEHAGQTLLTCTEPSAAGKKVLDLAQVYKVGSGKVSQ